MVPTKYGPKIKLKSLKILVRIPPFTLHHPKGIDNKLSMTTSNDQKVATGTNFFAASFGKKNMVAQEKMNKPNRITVGKRFFFLIN